MQKLVIINSSPRDDKHCRKGGDNRPMMRLHGSYTDKM